VLITISGAGSATTLTNDSGNYSFSGLADGSYSATPSLSGYTFSPTSNLVAISGANATVSNFVATAVPAPVAPSALFITSTTSTQVALSWTDNAATEEGFKIERSTDNSTFTVIATLQPNSIVFTDTTITSNTYYYYRVKTYNSGGDSAASNAVGTTTHTIATLVSMLSIALNSMQGNEIQFTGTSSSPPYTITTDLIGFAFCMPGSLYTIPAASATPPINVYGCANSLAITFAPSTNSVTITVSTPIVYIDGAVTVSGAGLSISNAPVDMVYNNVVLTLNATLIPTPDGRLQIGSVSSANMTHGNIDIYAQNSLLNFLLSFILNAQSSIFDPMIVNQVTTLSSQVIATMPPYVP
jgi:hypothetical protein